MLILLMKLSRKLREKASPDLFAASVTPCMWECSLPLSSGRPPLCSPCPHHYFSVLNAGILQALLPGCLLLEGMSGFRPQPDACDSPVPVPCQQVLDAHLLLAACSTSLPLRRPVMQGPLSSRCSLLTTRRRDCRIIL